MDCQAQKAAAALNIIKVQANVAVAGMLIVLADAGAVVTAALAAQKVLLFTAGNLNGVQNYTAHIRMAQYGAHVLGNVSKHHANQSNKTGGILAKFAEAVAQVLLPVTRQTHVAVHAAVGHLVQDHKTQAKVLVQAAGHGLVAIQPTRVTCLLAQAAAAELAL
jgi:hypothetical protein